MGYFGKYSVGSRLTRQKDFDVAKITAPISIHYAAFDRLADALDVEKLIPKLKSVVYVQRINELFNHMDFVWGKNAASLVYSKIIQVFQMH